MPEQPTPIGGSVNVNNGIATLTVNETLQPGTYTITGSYNQNENYKGSTGTAELEILKKTTTTSISTDKTEYLVGENITLSVSVKEGITYVIEGVFSIYVNNELLQSNVLITGSITSIQLNELSSTASTKSIRVIYQGTETYNSSTSDNKTIQVNKHEASLTPDVKLHTDEYSIITAQILDSNDNPITVGTVHAKLGGQNIVDDEENVIILTPDTEGRVEIVSFITGLTESSNYQVQLNYSGTGYYTSVVETLTITAIETPVLTGFAETNGICGIFKYTRDLWVLSLDITSTIPSGAGYTGAGSSFILTKRAFVIRYTDIYENTFLFSTAPPSYALENIIGTVNDGLFYEDGDYVAFIDDSAMDLLVSYEMPNPPSKIEVYLDDENFTHSELEILPYATDPMEGYLDLSNWGSYPAGTSGVGQTGTLSNATTSDFTIDTTNQTITTKNTKYFVYNRTLQDFFDYYGDEFSLIAYKTGGDGRYDLGFVNTTTGGYKLGYLCNSGSQVISNEENNIKITTHEVGDGQVKYQNYNQFTFKQIGTDIHMYYCIQGSRYVERTIPMGNIDPSQYYLYIKGYNQQGLSITTDESKIDYYSKQQ